MAWIIAVVLGAFVGWVASLIMETDEEQGPLLNIVIGIAGAVVGKWLFTDVLGIGSAATTGSLSLFGVMWAIVGAVVLIAILKAFNVLKY